jgi:phage/plasmid-associated DNA primase
VTSNGSVFAGDSTGIKDRTCLLIFDNQVAEELRSPSFEERLHSEINNLLAVSLSLSDSEVDSRIKGLHDAGATTYKTREWELKCDVSSVAAFIEDRVKPAPGKFIATSELYSKYRDYADENGLGKVAVQRFSKEMINLVNSYLRWEEIEPKKGYVDSKQVRGISGLELRGDSDDWASDTLAQSTDELAQSDLQDSTETVTRQLQDSEQDSTQTTVQQEIEENKTVETVKKLSSFNRLG